MSEAPTNETAASTGNAESPAVTANSILRCALVYGMGVGSLIGLAEVTHAYMLPVLQEMLERNFSLYLPTDGLFEFISTAIVVDTVLFTLIAILAGVAVLLVRAPLKAAHGSHLWSFLCRWLIIAGSFSASFLYLWVSYYQNSREGGDRAMNLTFIAVGTSLVALALAKLFGRAAGSRKGIVSPVPVAVWAVLMVAMLATTVVRFGSYSEEFSSKFARDPSKIAAGPNIVLFTLDTLRADALGCYGHPVIETPVIDALAAEGVLFEWAISQAPLTTESHCSIMTSLYPSQHGGMNGVAMQADVPTVAELLRVSGYQTAASVGATTTRSIDSGLHRGFDVYHDSLVPWTTFFGKDELQQLAVFQTLDWAIGTQIDGKFVTDRALAWLQDRPEGAFFLWVHCFDPHGPYGSAEEYKDKYKGKLDASKPMLQERVGYAGDVTYTDMLVGRVVDEIKKQGIWDETLVIVTSDHGEAFGEMHDDGNVEDTGHGRFLYDSTQHIPLIIKEPKPRLPGHRVTDQVQLVDLVPTILQYAGLPAPPSFEGASLEELLAGGTRDIDAQVAYAQRSGIPKLRGAPDDPATDKRLVARRTPFRKFISNFHGANLELYDLEADPGETTNILSRYLEEANLFKEQTLTKLLPEGPETLPEADARTIEQLRSLGYVGDD